MYQAIILQAWAAACVIWWSPSNCATKQQRAHVSNATCFFGFFLHNKIWPVCFIPSESHKEMKSGICGCWARKTWVYILWLATHLCWWLPATQAATHTTCFRQSHHHQCNNSIIHEKLVQHSIKKLLPGPKALCLQWWEKFQCIQAAPKQENWV